MDARSAGPWITVYGFLLLEETGRLRQNALSGGSRFEAEIPRFAVVPFCTYQKRNIDPSSPN
jgi:hypothetical protein